MGAGLGLGTWAETGLCTHWDPADVNNLCYANEEKKKKKKEVSCLDQKPDLRPQWEVAKGCGAAGNRKIRFIWP